MGTSVKSIQTKDEYVNDTTEFHLKKINDPNWNFNVNETTLSHLFRIPHPALNGKNYAQAFLDALLINDLIVDHNFFEVGCGTGRFARCFIDFLNKIRVEHFNYVLIDISRKLIEYQKRLFTNCNEGNIEFIVANALQLPFENNSIYGTLICNEVIADFKTVYIEEEWCENISETKKILKNNKEKIKINKEIIEGLTYIEKYNLKMPSDSFYINLGSFKFIEELERIFKPDSTAIIVEYSYNKRYPQREEYFDHIEYSIYFKHLEQVAKKLGLCVEILSLPKFLGLDTNVEILSLDNFTKKEEFIQRQLGLSFVWKKNIQLPTYGYTREILRKELNKEEYGLSRKDINNIMEQCEPYFVRICDDRFDSLKHSWKFKVLIIRK